MAICLLIVLCAVAYKLGSVTGSTYFNYKIKENK